MLISSGQIARRLAVMGVTIGDVSFDLSSKRLEVYGAAAHRFPALMVFTGDTFAMDAEFIVNECHRFFFDQPQKDPPIMDDGRKVAV